MPGRTALDDMGTPLEPFLVARREAVGLFDLAPLGERIAPGHVFDPTRMESCEVFDRLAALDALTFGPEGMPMPRWMFYELAALPGAIFGFGVRAESLGPGPRERLQLPADARGLVPVSMYIAIPVEPPGVWCGHNLASLNRALPELGLHGLAGVTKAAALRCLRCRKQIGATQWDSDALFVHTKLGLLELLSAWTPAHAFAETLTYRLAVTEAGLRVAMGVPGASAIDRPRADFEIDADDHDAMRRLQQRIEAGGRYTIVGKPRLTGVGRCVPIARIG